MAAAHAQPKNSLIERPPVVVVMGHIDHGKSKLLDYIRKTSVVENEAGGITQRVSAYEVEHKTKEGETKRITFLDTPGHEAFQLMRSRSAGIADIAILVVSAEDGVKAQTLEALGAIQAQGIPFVVALSKIDKPNADVMRAKGTLIEHGIYPEGMGGDVPVMPISSKSGEGVPELLDLVLLAAALADLKGDPDKQGEGVVVEAHRDERRGNAATLVVKDGTVSTGDCIVAGNAVAPVRIMEDTAGKPVKSASFSMPIRVVGFSDVPPVGSGWRSFRTKKEAEGVAKEFSGVLAKCAEAQSEEDTRTVIPVILKADVSGSLDAIEHELAKFPQERVILRVVAKGVGAISENDIKAAGTNTRAIALGFNIGVDSAARDLAERLGISIQTFDIIYRLVEWLGVAIAERTPKQTVTEVTGLAKILRTFSRERTKQVVGARVESGRFDRGAKFTLTRRGEVIGTGEILGLQHNRSSVPKVEEGDEFGVEVDSKNEIMAGDHLECSKTVEK